MDFAFNISWFPCELLSFDEEVTSGCLLEGHEKEIRQWFRPFFMDKQGEGATIRDGATKRMNMVIAVVYFHLCVKEVDVILAGFHCDFDWFHLDIYVIYKCIKSF